jgi:PAS domain S-box-containing protein
VFKGSAIDEVVGKPFSLFYTVEDIDAGVPQQDLETATACGRMSTEGWRRRLNDEVFRAQVSIERVRDHHGMGLGFVEITRDITDRYRAEQALRESQRTLRLFIEGVADYALFRLDPQGIVNSWNTGAQRIKGYSAAEIIGQHFSQFYTPEDRANNKPAHALEIARTQGRYLDDGWRVRKDGTRFWASVVVDALYDETGELIGFAKITRDDTELRETRLRLEEAREQLFQSQKLEALGQLTGGIAHDFNNMLQGMLTALELGRSRLKCGLVAEADKLMESGVAAANCAARLTRRLLGFARQQPLHGQAIAVNQLVRSMEELLRRTMSENIDIRLDLAAGLPMAWCDPQELESALLNLAINARDAMPAGGSLSILTSVGELPQATGGEAAEQHFVRVRVDDTGAGMSREVLRRAFDPFFTTKPGGKGTGLGLSMVHGFAKQSGGEIRIESQEGMGTTIELFLPQAGERASKPMREPQPPASRAKSSGVVLVVDDDDVIRRLVGQALREAGFNVLEAPDGDAAWAVLQEEGPHVSLLLTDVGLPGLNGQQFAETAKRLYPSIKVLFMTGYAADVQLAEAQDTTLAVLSKPFELAVLLQKVQELLATDP